MTKPSWNKAPEWANYLAQDKDGLWTFFENEPYTNLDAASWDAPEGRYYTMDVRGDSWQLTLEKGEPTLTVVDQLNDLLQEKELSWASYVAQDADGEWWAYSHHPERVKGMDHWVMSKDINNDTNALYLMVSGPTMVSAHVIFEVIENSVG